MNVEIGLTLGIILMALILFATEKLRVDLIALIVLLLVSITGLVRQEDVFSGFANPAVITIWAVYIVSGGLFKTGVADMLVEWRLLEPLVGELGVAQVRPDKQGRHPQTDNQAGGGNGQQRPLERHGIAGQEVPDAEEEGDVENSLHVAGDGKRLISQTERGKGE